MFGINSAGKITLYAYGGNPTSIESISSVPLNTWTHFSIALSAKKVIYYINGIDVSPVNSTIISLELNRSILSAYIGSSIKSDNSPRYYISNYRISNNVRYPSNFTVPSFPLKPDNNTIILYQYPYDNKFWTRSQNLSVTNVNILSGYNYSKFCIRNSYICRDIITSNLSAPSLMSPLIMDSVKFSNFSLENSVVTGYEVNGITFNVTRNLIEGSYLFNNTYLGSVNFTDLNKYQPTVYKTTGFAFTNYNKISGNHFTYVPMGIKIRDTSLYDISNPDLVSERLIPTSKTVKLKSSSKYVALNANQTTIIKVKLLVSSNYNGNLPRLMLKRNSAVGVFQDTVLGVFNPTLGYNVFREILGETTSIPVLDNCALEFYVDCDGTQGYVCIDNWSAI
jgi:hypothetical protein